MTNFLIQAARLTYLYQHFTHILLSEYLKAVTADGQGAKL